MVNISGKSNAFVVKLVTDVWSILR